MRGRIVSGQARYKCAGKAAETRAYDLPWNAGRRVAMTHLFTLRSLLGFVEHAAFMVVGFAFMVIGLGLGVTMIMLPVGLVVGLFGFAMFVGGLLVRDLNG